MKVWLLLDICMITYWIHGWIVVNGNVPIKVTWTWPFLGLKWIFFGLTISVWVRTRVLKSWVLNPNLETWVSHPRKPECFQFSGNLFFSAIFDFILCFSTSLSSETWSFLVIAFWCSTGFQTQLFKARVLTHTYYWGFQIRVHKWYCTPKIGEAEFLPYFKGQIIS